MKYRAEIFVKGATTAKVYRNTLEGVERAAIKELTRFEPGLGSLYPECIEIYENMSPRGEPKPRWQFTKTVSYAAVPKEQHEWRKRQALHAQR